MASRTDFITAIKKLDNPDSTLQDLGSDLIDEALTDALREYSEYSPRGYRTVTITVAVDDTEILLPVDCLEISTDTAYLLVNGIEATHFRAPGSYPLRSSGRLQRDHPLGITSDPPYQQSQSDPAAIPLSTNTAGRISIVLSEAATEARTHDIRYQAYHVITDSPDYNTVPQNDRRKLRSLVLGYMAEARAKIATDPIEITKWETRAAKYFAVRDEFIVACGGLG